MSYWTDPFREFRRLQKEMDTLFSESFSGNNALTGPSSSGTVATTSQNDNAPALPGRRWAPVVDVKETDKEIIVDAEVPGMNKQDIKVEVDQNNVLKIYGENKYEKKVDNEKWHRVERSWGSFTRTLQLPETATADKISAKYENGVLHLTIPKREGAPAPKTKSITIA
eukprot:ANDGO_00159.mRNA.1 17.7 kDa class I heat shock protein